MRILQVAPPWFAVPPRRYGGTELVISTLANGLVAAGHEVVLLAAGGSTSDATVHSVLPDPPSEDLGDLVTELLHVMAVDDLGDFDVVHDHTLLGTARLAARGTWPLVHTLHGPWSPRSRAVYRRLADRTALVAISHDQASHAPEVDVAAVIHHGLDVERYPVSVDRTDALVFVGRAAPEKGPDVAIEVARRTGRPLRMAIKVNEPAEHRYFERVVSPALEGVEAEVVVDASHGRKVAWMATAHAVLTPISWDEPFGLVLAEAGACGTPVVTFGRGAAPEIVDDGRTGFVVPPGAGIEALCDAVEAAGTIDPAVCRDHVASRFCAERMVDDHCRLYERIVAQSGRRAGRLDVPLFLAPRATGGSGRAPDARPVAGAAARVE